MLNSFLLHRAEIQIWSSIDKEKKGGIQMLNLAIAIGIFLGFTLLLILIVITEDIKKGLLMLLGVVGVILVGVGFCLILNYLQGNPIKII